MDLLVMERRPGPSNGAGAAHPSQVQFALPGVDLLAGHRHQRPQLGVVVSCADVLEHDVSAITALRDFCTFVAPDRPGAFRTNTTNPDHADPRGVSIRPSTSR
nr:hypothetical protein [Nocardioides insulae]